MWDRVRRRGRHGDLSPRERDTLRAVYLARLVPNYARQGYLRQLLEYAAAKSKATGGGTGAGAGADGDRLLSSQSAGGTDIVGRIEGDSDDRAATDNRARAHGVDAEDDAEDDVEDDVEDELLLLNVLRASKIVKRPRKMKFGRPVKDDHARIMSEVELVPPRPEPTEE